MGVLTVLDGPGLDVSFTVPFPSNLLTIFLMVSGLGAVLDL